MRRTLFCIAAVAILAVGLSSPSASACEAGCRYAPHPAYYGPPVYSYSYFAPPYGAARHRPAFYGYYTARINIFRGPRWNYSAAYYNSPPARRGYYGRHGRRAVVYGYRPYRGYIRGPIFRVWRRR